MIKRPFDRVSSPLFWALLIDSIDAAFIVASALLSAVFFPLGLFRDFGVNIIQSLLSGSIFEAPFIAATQLVDFTLPSPLHQLPPNTLAVLFLEHPEWSRNSNENATLKSIGSARLSTQHERFLSLSAKPAKEAGEEKYHPECLQGLFEIHHEGNVVHAHAPKVSNDDRIGACVTNHTECLKGASQVAFAYRDISNTISRMG